MNDVSTTSFQGFEGDGTVATAVLNTNSVSTQNVPGVCNGYMEDGGYFQSLLRTDANSKDVIMGTCSYYQGGMIISTIDVATYSSRADSATFPLLGNMLGFSVTPYPEGFGSLGTDLGLTIDGDAPNIDPSTGGYATHYMKSDATVNLTTPLQPPLLFPQIGFLTDLLIGMLLQWLAEPTTQQMLLQMQPSVRSISLQQQDVCKVNNGP
jgi:hypothetical protein